MRIRVVGAYLPRLDWPSVKAYIARDIENFRTTLHRLREEGICKASADEIEARALELPEEYALDLGACALFEIEVLGNTAEFDATDIRNPETGACGWEPAFLSLDGLETIDCPMWGKAPPSLRDFRAAFYVHDWNDGGRLIGPTGELSLPPFEPVPERLWRLAPYALVD
jgi:hypothetical protein